MRESTGEKTYEVNSSDVCLIWPSHDLANVTRLADFAHWRRLTKQEGYLVRHASEEEDHIKITDHIIHLKTNRKRLKGYSNREFDFMGEAQSVREDLLTKIFVLQAFRRQSF